MNWQPIETAPKDGTVVDVVWNGDPHFEAYFHAGVWRTLGDWMPLDPQPTLWTNVDDPTEE